MSVDQTWMIEARGLSKFYGSFAAIREVSFAIPQGQVAAFLGPNGAGKSTTLKILTGYLAPSAGSALIAGLDVAASRIEAAARVGYLPENGPLYPEMTPLELLQFFGEARGLENGRLRSRIDAVVHQCALEAVLEKSIFKLSKGYRQRAGMAQALLHDPDILIMDEPTSGLDPNQIREVRELIRTLGKTKTILLSTHILQEVEAVAGHVILVNEGRVIFDGTPQEMAAGRTLEQAFYELTGNLPVAAKTTAAKNTAAPPPDSTGTGGSAAEAVTQAAFPRSTVISAAEAVTRAAFPKGEAKTSTPVDGATDDLRDAGGAE